MIENKHADVTLGVLKGLAESLGDECTCKKRQGTPHTGVGMFLWVHLADEVNIKGACRPLRSRVSRGDIKDSANFAKSEDKRYLI